MSADNGGVIVGALAVVYGLLAAFGTRGLDEQKKGRFVVWGGIAVAVAALLLVIVIPRMTA